MPGNRSRTQQIYLERPNRQTLVARYALNEMTCRAERTRSTLAASIVYFFRPRLDAVVEETLAALEVDADLANLTDLVCLL